MASHQTPERERGKSPKEMKILLGEGFFFILNARDTVHYFLHHNNNNRTRPNRTAETTRIKR